MGNMCYEKCIDLKFFATCVGYVDKKNDRLDKISEKIFIPQGRQTIHLCLLKICRS